jgi:hypothetical protein
MRSERSTVVGVFEDHAAADRAIEELHRAGFSPEEIGYVARGADDESKLVTEPTTSDAGAGALSGIAAGAGIGALLGAAASLAIPGFGPLIVGGMLTNALAGAALGSAAGGSLGMLAGLGVSDDESTYYESQLTAGRTLVTVQAGPRYDEAKEILRRTGADGIEPAGQLAGGGTIPTASEWDQFSPHYRQHWMRRFGTSGGRWEEFEPGYRYGHEMATDPGYANREWVDVEDELRRNYGTWGQRYGYSHGESDWARYRESVRHAWDESRTRRRAA